MKKEDKLIMVVRRQDLFRSPEGFDDSFNGFKSIEKIDYESRILNNYGFMTRKFAEKDSNYKQPIGYCAIVNPTLKKIFSFQRSKKDDNYSEKNMQGKFSWGAGGHIEKDDMHDENANPIYNSLLREVTKEEVEIINGSISIPKALGYINDDKNDVGKLHFGILYLIETDSTEIIPKDPEIDNGKLRNINELEQLLKLPEIEVEEWSRISFMPLKAYLKNL